MTQPEVLEGTWEEIKRHEKELVGRRLTVIVMPTGEKLSDDAESLLAEGCAKSALETMIASEAVLARDWNRPEEEEAWADL